MSKKKPAPAAHPERPPSADTLLSLERLLVGPLTADTVRQAWRLITAAQTHPDFFAVQDYAVERGFCVPCGATDPRREPNPTWVNPLDGSEMVWIPPGRCRLGPEQAAKWVDVPGFSLAKYAVTNEQFADFLNETSYPAHPSTDVDGIDRGDYENAAFLAHWQNGRPPRARNRPVVYVSYLDTLAYCEWAGLSVPGEYQWEKAARGSDGRRFPWGDSGYPTRARKSGFANYGHDTAAAVTEFADVRSPYGCVQLVGNVAAWCQPGDALRLAEVPPASPRPVLPLPGQRPFATCAPARGGAFKRRSPVTLEGARRARLSVVRRNDWVGIRPACFLPVRPVAV